MDANSFLVAFNKTMQESNKLSHLTKQELNLFCSSSTDKEQTYLDFYKNSKKPSFTNFINKVIIPKVLSSSFSLKPENSSRKGNSYEYYRIDVTGWESKSNSIIQMAAPYDLNPHLWNLKVAVEHENDPKDWNDEVLKLLHINCPLRVVIGYNYCDKRDGDENDYHSDKGKLAFVAECVAKTEVINSFNGELLVILGNCKHQNIDYTCFDYRGYLLDKEKGFEQIKPTESKI